MQKYWPEKRYRDKDSIWVALNRVNQQEVILKFFPMDRTDESKVSREAYTMRYLFNEDPKHFLELYDYLEDSNENQYTIAMEKAECSLEDVVTERGFVSEEEAIPVIRELLYAIQVMHKNNFIHRDLKLSNILLRDKNDLSSVTIIDFGETLDRTEEYYISGIVGTLHYMAPEILKKKKYYKPVDIWALGVISYRLLTGYFPYITEGDNHSKQLKAILNNEVSYLRYDNVRLSNKAIDFINCLLEVDPLNRMSIQTALDHPFLNPEFEGEFVPYKPIPKFSKKMAKDNVQDGKVIKRLLTRAVRRNKKQDQAAVIDTLFSKDKANSEPNDENNTEEDGKESRIHYSKTCVQPRRNEPFMGGTQTIDRMHMKHNQYDEVPPYLNVTLGRSSSHNSQNRQYNNDYVDENDYDNVKYSNTHVPPSGNTAGNVNNKTKGYVPPTGNTAGNVNYNNSDEYIPPYANTEGHDDEQYNNNGYSNNYSPYGNNNSNNRNNNYLAPKLPKTAGNSIDPYANSYDDYPQNSNQNNGYSANPNMNNNNYSDSNMNNNYQKPPKTAGNSIDPYGNFQNINMPKPNYSVKNQFAERYGNEIKKSNTVNGPTKSKNSPSPHDQPSTKSDDYRHYRRDNDSVHSHHRKTSSSGSRQSYERDYRRYDNDYDSDHGRRRYDEDSRSRHRYEEDSQSRHRYEEDSQSRHRKTNSSGSRPRYDDDSYGHHRRTSSGSRPRYDDDDDEIYGRHRSESSPSRPYVAPLTALNSSKRDNYGKPYTSKRPSPLVNAATIKNSNAADTKESKSSKIKEKTKNILPMDIKLKIDARPMKLPPVISNHPSRNSSLKNKK